MTNFSNLTAPISPEIDQALPACIIIWGKFGGLAPFCRAMGGMASSTAQGFLYRGHIPHRFYRQVLKAAKDNGIEMVPGDFLERDL